MKIVFLCGSLAEGLDGVGDYTRMLAIKLIKNGHKVGAVALNDHHATSIFGNDESVEGIQLPVLQIPSNISNADRYKYAAKFIRDFNPDWVSLQFVIYAFHKKGLPFGLGRQLSTLTKGRRVHIMFHEIWIGFTKISTFTHKITGLLQKGIIKKMVKKLQPSAICTSNFLYKLILKQAKIEVDILQLFSNIPFYAIKENEKETLLRKFEVDNQQINQYSITGIFGNLYPEARLQDIVLKQFEEEKAKNKQLIFVGFGRINTEGRMEFDRLKSIFADKVKFFHLGELPSHKISHLFQILNTAISCTPRQHIGKSGVFAALKFHNVEVILTQGDVIPEYHQRLQMYYEEFVKRPAYQWDVSYTAKNFINILEQ